MMWLIFVLLLTATTHSRESIAAMRDQTANDIVPMWGCWYQTYPTSDPNISVLNLLFSYNNTQDYEITVATDLPENRMTPAQFNGYQPFLFKTGLNLYSVSLADTRSYMKQQTVPAPSVTWALGDKLVVVDQSMLSREERCDVKYNGTCPTWIDGFCDDTLYCNGVETCFTPSIFLQLTQQVLGQCTQPQQGVQCSVSQICSEEQRACVLAETAPPVAPLIMPLFTCWSYVDAGSSAPGSTAMQASLVFGYNNTGDVPVTRYVTMQGDNVNLDARNNIAPDVYNTAQTVLFRAGYTARAFTVVDTMHVLPGASITWSLMNQQVVVTAADLTDANLCEGPTSQPTTAPTAATTSPQPDITLPPIEEVSDEDTPQCSLLNPDCTPYDSFCNGPTQCDTASGFCVVVDPTYSPCNAVASASSMGRPGTEQTLQCVENALQCIASVMCYDDTDCNNGFICDGRETCVDGACVSPTNVTIVDVCHYANAICIERVGCFPTDQTPGSVVVPATWGAILLLAIIIFFFVMYYRYTHPTAGGGAKDGISQPPTGPDSYELTSMMNKNKND
jgi:hypothetical protein